VTGLSFSWTEKQKNKETKKQRNNETYIQVKGTDAVMKLVLGFAPAHRKEGAYK
jgi:hypothetical protein